MDSLRPIWPVARRERRSVSAVILDGASNEATGQIRHNPEGGSSRSKARPHPDPLPKEREPAMAVLGKSLNGEHSPALENLLPLPGGEGWGKGEREFQLNRYG